MIPGKFIALEGGEGTGKSTQSLLLADALKRLGLTPETTREPGGTPGAEAIRLLLLDPPGEGWGAKAEAMLFAAARSDHIEKRIQPALEAGRWVVCDRFVDSSRAYQGGAGGLGDDFIASLHRIGSGGIRPDMTLIIDVPARLTRERLSARDTAGNDAIGGRADEYHMAVRQHFLKIADDDPASVTVIDGDGSPEDIHSRIMAALSPLLPVV